jgi:pimeloyl-ACP methyl ester carboxylesterase
MASAQDRKSQFPEPVDVTLKTRGEPDGSSVELTATYYRSNAGTNAPVVMLLHMQGRDRRDWASFAATLQSADFAVLALDLRGHGDSKVTRQGATEPISPDQMRKEDYANMYFDLEAAKRFLLEKNNARELNVEKLGVVAAEMSTPVAVRWAQEDWNWEALPGLGKQGKDVKALVLITPHWSYQGVDIRESLPVLRGYEKLAMLFIAGQKDRRSMRDAMRMFDVVHSHNKEKTEGKGYDTSLTGTMMLGKDLPLEEDVIKFLTEHLKNASEPWTDRSKNR